MDFPYLAELLFPNVTMTPEEVEAKYPPRDLPEGAKVLIGETIIPTAGVLVFKSK